jgi:NADH-quinone oxidoreductase subunit G
LLGRIARHLGTANIDHRVRSRDFRDQDNDPKAPWLGIDVAALDVQQGVLVVGSNLRMEVPIFAHRLRKAALKGAAVAFVNPASYTYHFPLAAEIAASLDGLLPALAGVLAAAVEAKGVARPGHVAQALEDAVVIEEHRAAADALTRSPALLLLGHIAQRHPRYADLRALAAALADVTGARLGYLAEGANGFGAALAGVLPHRGVGGAPCSDAGLNARAMLEQPRRAYLLHGLEPDRDFADATLARRALGAADAVVALTPYASESLLELATVLLPIGTFAETAGTFVNAEGRWQSFDAAANAVGEARPGWRLLRVLGNELELAGCDYVSAAEIAAALERELGSRGAPAQDHNTYRGRHEVSFGHRAGAPVDAADTAAITAVTGAEAIDVPIYAVDAIVRRSEPLQHTAVARRPGGGV